MSGIRNQFARTPDISTPKTRITDNLAVIRVVNLIFLQNKFIIDDFLTHITTVKLPVYETSGVMIGRYIYEMQFGPINKLENN